MCKKNLSLYIMCLLILGCDNEFTTTVEINKCDDKNVISFDSQLNNPYHELEYYQISQKYPCQRHQCVDGEWDNIDLFNEDNEDNGICENSCTTINLTKEIDDIKEDEIINGNILDEDGNIIIEEYKLNGEDVLKNGVVICGQCINNKMRCNNNNIEICKNGQWVVSEDCAKRNYFCRLTNNEVAECSVCEEGKVIYENNENNICDKKICKDGMWIEDLVCKFSCSVDDKNKNIDCGECVNGDIKCSENNLSDIMKCEFGKWVKQLTCEDDNGNSQSCVIKTDTNNNKFASCGACKNKHVYYENNKEEKCQQKVCVDGHYEWGDLCENNNSCAINENNENVCGVCENGERKCDEDVALDDNGVKNVTDILACKDGIWKKEQTCIDGYGMPASCNMVEYCEGENVEKCNNGSSGLIPQCGGCINDTIVYKNDMNNKCYSLVCNNGVWNKKENDEEKENKDGYSCRYENGAYIIGECLNGDRKCDDQIFSDIMVCQDGEWVKEQTCYDSEGIIASCISKAVKKDSTDGTGEDDKDGDGTGEGGTGEGGTGEGGTGEGGTGEGGTGEGGTGEGGTGEGGTGEGGTGEGGTGEGGTGEEVITCGACNIGSKYYKNNESEICTHYVCDDGKWLVDNEDGCVNNNSCKYNNSGILECGECKNGNMKCDNDKQKGGTIYICENGKWIVNLECNNVSCVQIGSAAKCGNCLNESRKVENDNNQYCHEFICNEGVWDNNNEFTCATSCMNDGCGVCRNNDKKYENDENDGNKCYYVTCENGQWETKKEYDPNGNSCHLDGNNSGYGECVNGNTTCKDMYNGGIQYTCKNGINSIDMPCTSCVGNYCTVSCTNNTCKDDTSSGYGLFCMNHTLTPCQDMHSCHLDDKEEISECGSCRNNSYEYIEESGICYKKGCKNGTIQEKEKCGDVSCAKDNNNNSIECGECKDGTVEYNDDLEDCRYKVCVNGSYGELITCPDHVSCTDMSTNPKCGKCKDGEKQFKQDEYIYDCVLYGQNKKCYYNDICSYKECSNGVYSDSIDSWLLCPDIVSCKLSGDKFVECGECRNNTTKCEGNKEYSCQDGKWKERNDCGTKGCYGTSYCRECNDGTKNCEGNNLKTCKNGQYETTTCTNGCEGNMWGAHCKW